MRAGMTSCLRKWSIFSTKLLSGSSASGKRRKKTIDPLPPFRDPFVNVHDGGVDLVPVHRLGKIQSCRPMPGAQGWIVLIVGQLHGHGVDIARLRQSTRDIILHEAGSA